jgi:hypothetical protein
MFLEERSHLVFRLFSLRCLYPRLRLPIPPLGLGSLRNFRFLIVPVPPGREMRSRHAANCFGGAGLRTAGDVETSLFLIPREHGGRRGGRYGWAMLLTGGGLFCVGGGY